MSAKHFIDDPNQLVRTALESCTRTNPSLSVDLDNKIVYRKASQKSTVSIISGGGSGHEPSFASFVGDGLLAAAVAGTIFASPSAEQVRRCILDRVDKKKGVLVIVMNYTGDVLNFGMAVEKAKAAGIDVDMVIVGDDAGVGRKQGGKVGRRGIAGTVLVQKAAGALAAQGAPIQDVCRIAQLVADNVVSIGASLSHVHVPGRTAPQPSKEDLKIDEVEIGMGIHNEPGSEKVNSDLPGTVRTMLAHMLDPQDQDRAFLSVSPNDETVLLVNNLGGVSPLEMGGITTEVINQLEGTWGIKPVRILSGTYMTSLNGLGFSISLLRLVNTGLDGISILDLLGVPAEATGWSAAISASTWSNKSEGTIQAAADDVGEANPSNLEIDSVFAKTVLTKGLERVISAEPDITNYDTIVGDGDCGIGLMRGAEAILKLLNKASRQPSDAALFLDKIIPVVENSMDGTSGALYAIFLNALAHGLRQISPSSPTPITPRIWAQALQSSLDALGKYTPAKPGDRTLIDALYPFVKTLSKTGDVKSSVEAAEAGATGTKGMKASLGRTVYVGGEGWQGVPDPGAYGLAEFLLGLGEVLQ